MVSVYFMAGDSGSPIGGLNPYFCGRWFLCMAGDSGSPIGGVVLILISVEDGFCEMVI